MAGHGMAARGLACGCALLFGHAAVPAQSLLYTPQKPLPAAAAEQPDPRCNVTLARDQLVGKKIVFLPQTKQFQQNAYGGYTIDEMGFRPPRYDQLVGRIATVMAIGPEASLPKIRIKVDETGLILNGYVGGEVRDVVLLDDLQWAKAHYIGKTLWVKNRRARLTQDIEVFEGVTLPQYSALEIVDVVPGTNAYDSLDFVGRTQKGMVVLVPGAVSESVISPDVAAMNRKHDEPQCRVIDHFFFENPRAKYDWPDSVWKNIEIGNVVLGMTYDQVVMAKGIPDAFNERKTATSYSGQLVYGHHYYYIDAKGVVTAIED